jgi:hypothetical protein
MSWIHFVPRTLDISVLGGQRGRHQMLNRMQAILISPHFAMDTEKAVLDERL